MPKLSIISINLNNAQGLQKTFDSVVNQTFTDFEYVIIDGGSSDASKEIIKKNACKLSYWVSEEDKGIYDAMNKGISNANGTYILFLNSGDYFFDDNVLESIFKQHPIEDIIYGNQLLIGIGVKKYPDQLPLSFFLSDSLPHQATFIKKELFKKVGVYSLKYKIASDYKFFIEALYLHQCSYRHFDTTIVNFDLNGLSNKYWRDILSEFEMIRKESLKNFIGEYELLWQKSNHSSLIPSTKPNRILQNVKKLLARQSFKK